VTAPKRAVFEENDSGAAEAAPRYEPPARRADVNLLQQRQFRSEPERLRTKSLLLAGNAGFTSGDFNKTL
jgi:hypothetical protein